MLGGFGGFAADVIVKVTARKDNRADSAVDQHRDTDRLVAASKPGLNQRRVLVLDVVSERAGGTRAFDLAAWGASSRLG